MQSPQGKAATQVRAHVLSFSRLEARLYGVELCSNGTLMLRSQGFCRLGYKASQLEMGLCDTYGTIRLGQPQRK